MNDDAVARVRAPRLNALSLAIALALGSGAAPAATITVTDASDTPSASTCTLRQAVSAHLQGKVVGACVAGSGDDTIAFDASVTAVTLGSSLLVSSSANLVIDGGAALGQRTISLAPTATGSVIVKGTNATSTLTLAGLTISGGNAAGAGGGVYDHGPTTLTLNHSVVTNNSATGSGGGVAATAVVLNDSVVSNNVAGSDGGGVYASSSVSLTNTTISGNTATGTGGGVSGNVIAELSTFSVNAPTGWSGVEGDFRDSRIVGNSGGGLKCLNWTSSNHVSLTNSIISGNTLTAADRGAAVDCYGITLAHGEVSGNRNAVSYYASVHAGIRGQNVIVSGSTFYDNRATRHIQQRNSTNAIYAAGALTISNSTVTNNSCDCNTWSHLDIWVPPTAQLDSSLLNFVGNPSTSVTPQGSHNLLFATQLDASLLTAAVTGNAALGPLADNGCAVPAGAATSAACVKTRSLGLGSVAINAGAAGTETTDERGAGFARVLGAAADIGAFEVPAGLLLVSGNGIAIADGDTTPSAADATDFGTTKVGTAVSLTYLLRNTGSPTPLQVDSIAIGGAHATDFVVTPPVTFPLVIAPNATSSLTLTFNPGAVGNRHATITFNNDGSADSAYQFAVQGQGTTLPVAAPLSVGVPFDTPQTLQLAASDSSPNGPFTFAYAIASGVSHGTLTLDGATGSVTYTPNTAFSGADAFTYTVSDANGTSLPASVSLSVASASALVAQPASASTAYLTPVTVALAAFDPNPGTSPITFVIATPPAHGTVSLGTPTTGGAAPVGAHAISSANGSVVATYTPAFGFGGTDSFTFTAGNANGTSAPATVSIAVAQPIMPAAVPTPLLSRWSLLALMAQLGIAAWYALRRVARRDRRH